MLPSRVRIATRRAPPCCPSVTYNNQALYTQAAAAPVAEKTLVPVLYIANNAVHEYVSQANVHETIDLAGFAAFRRASATAALARARAEIASRGLVVTVVQSYYAVAAAQQKMETAHKAAEEGENFLKLTQDLEKGGEVAHSDVIKADLQSQDRRRQFQEAQLGFPECQAESRCPDFSRLQRQFRTLPTICTRAFHCRRWKKSSSGPLRKTRMSAPRWK